MKISKNGPMTPKRGARLPTAGVKMDSAGSDPLQDAPATDWKETFQPQGEINFQTAVHKLFPVVHNLLNI